MSSAAYLVSVNLGQPSPTTAPGPGRTGIVKAPVEEAVLRAPGPRRGGLGSGVEGDFIGNGRYHGGDGQAVYAVAREELDWWGTELGRHLPDGMFGENLTTAGLDVDDALVGEVWQVGETVLQVTGPRVPCRTFATRMGERGWVRRYAAQGRSGAYLAVEVPGMVRPGDQVVVVERPGHGIGVIEVFRAFHGDLEAAQRVLGAACLRPDAQRDLERRVARRQRSLAT